jgi:hypothetical protein
MALLNPASDLRDFLTGKVAGSVTLTAGVNLYAGRMLADDLTPGQAVFLLNTGGMPPRPYLGDGTNYFTAAVQCLVRGPVGNLEAGEALARGVWSLLHQAPLGAYVQILARDSAPVLLDVDSAQRGRWAVNVDASYTG